MNEAGDPHAQIKARESNGLNMLHSGEPFRAKADETFLSSGGRGGCGTSN